LYCGIAFHARRMSVCIVSHEGARWLHRPRQAAPEPFLQAVAPSREGLGGAVECLCTWYGRADLGAAQGLPCVWGHARSRQALHGGQAKNAKRAAPKMATLRRGGMVPQADGYPAEMRATRAGRRRRPHLRRKRAELLAHVQQTHRQSNVPESGPKIAYKAHRAGGAERFAAPAGPNSSEVDLALLDS
jgi:hypothetical protein